MPVWASSPGLEGARRQLVVKFIVGLLLMLVLAGPAEAVTPHDVLMERQFTHLIMKKQYRWNWQEFHCVDVLWGDRESGWDPRNTNSIGASGIPQRLGNGELPSDWSSPGVQIYWGLNYIRGRYGSPCMALSHSYNYNWY